MSRRARLIPLALSVVFFGASLPFEAAVYERIAHGGAFMLALGWMGLLMLQVGWCANPLLTLGWFLLAFAKSRTARITNVVVLGFALLLALSSFVTLSQMGMIGRNEGESAGDFLTFGPAIFLWAASVLVAFVGAVLSLRAGASPTADSGPRS